MNTTGSITSLCGRLRKSALSFVLVITPVLFLGAGCQDTAQPSSTKIHAQLRQDTQDDATQAPEEFQQMLSREDHAVVVTHIPTQQTSRIPAEYPQDIQWLNADTALWIEDHHEDKGIYSIESASTADKEKESQSMYVSQHPLTQLGASASGNHIAVKEESALFVIHPETRAVHRVAEYIDTYEWSPQRQALIYSAQGAWNYVEIESDGTPATTVTVLESNPAFSAITFLTDSELLAVHTTEDGEILTRIDLTTKEQVALAELEPWHSSEKLRTIFASPNGKHAIVQESTPEQPYGTAYLYATDEESVKPIAQQVRIAGWMDANHVAWTQQIGDTHVEDVFRYSIPLHADERIATGVDNPTVFEYTQSDL